MEVGKSGRTLHDDHASVTADVAEGLVVRTGDYVATVTAHQAEFRCGGWERIVEVSGA